MTNDEYIKIADEYEIDSFIESSSIKFGYRYIEKKDIEIACLISHWLSYGEYSKYMIKIDNILTNIMQNKPYEYIMSGLWIKYKDDYTCLYKVISWHNFACLCEKLRFIYINFKDLEDAMIINFKDKRNKFKYYYQSLCALLSGESMIPTPMSNNINVRINRFLMCMIRNNSNVDIGIWDNFKKNDLIVPCDTKMVTISKNLGIINKVDENIYTAIAITNFAKKIFSNDPSKMYYALYGIGKNVSKI